MRRLPAVMLVFGLVVGVCTGVAVAAFSSQTNPVTGTFSTKRIYTGARSTTAFEVDDRAGGGSGVDASALLAVDGNYDQTDSWTAAAFNTGRYLDVDLNSALPGGLAITSPTVTVRFSDNLNTAGDDFCYYLDVRRISTGTVLGTYGSAAAPLACEAINILTTITTSVPAVTSTDDLNDLRVRIYGRHSAGVRARIDRVTVAANVFGYGVTLYPIRQIDVADGTAATTPWGLAESGDSAAFLTASNWSSSFSTSRYLAFDFPKYVPAGAQVTSVSLDHAYKSNTSGDTTCWYLEVYNGTTLIGTHGSSGAPISCNGTTSYVSNNVSLPEVNTGAEAGDVVVRVYARNTGSRRSLHDLLRLNVTYSLSNTGCTDPGGTVWSVSSEDAYVDQATPTTNYATTTNVRIRSLTGNQNRRAFINFPLATMPDGCSTASATLWIYFDTVQSSGTRTIEARRVQAAWDDTTLTWSNQPATDAASGTTTNTVGFKSITVTTAVQAMYSTGAYGFMLRDAAESNGSSVEQLVRALDSGTAAYLLVDPG